MNEEAVEQRIFLVAPSGVGPEECARLVADALAGAPASAVLVTASQGEPETEARARAIVPVVQAAGAAAIVENFTRAAGHAGADGVHISSGFPDLKAAAESFRPNRIVGAGKLRSRHAAMEAGELDLDYLFFGEPEGDTHSAPYHKAVALAEWWAELMEIPAVIMAGADLATLSEAAASGAEFIALRRAIWEAPEGPQAAMRRAAEILAGGKVAA
ncbi:thiamine phosphate synthase [Afifella sp. IM 167]|uniref:thiamine phosphate synthase n=1 Tax=Afifella sp. IM 167 TaxID=2033586 RepID=UPI001CCF9178|nr:thiamine phosphate synthase [Afifella sp. IM 167]MBZ8133065.1 thiamine phosphate synthase [Afifella sp. IM 167]